MKNNTILAQRLSESPLGIISGFFRSNLSLEVLWGLTIITMNPEPELFEKDEFRQWIEKTWGIKPKPEKLKDMLIPYVKEMGGWKLQLEANGSQIDTLMIPFTEETHIISMGAVHTDYADKVVYTDADLYLLLQFNHSLLKSTWGQFTARIAEADIFNQPHNILYSNPLPLV